MATLFSLWLNQPTLSTSSYYKPIQLNQALNLMINLHKMNELETSNQTSTNQFIIIINAALTETNMRFNELKLPLETKLEVEAIFKDDLPARNTSAFFNTPAKKTETQPVPAHSLHT
jgi:hypothetical protein